MPRGACPCSRRPPSSEAPGRAASPRPAGRGSGPRKRLAAWSSSRCSTSCPRVASEGVLFLVDRKRREAADRLARMRAVRATRYVAPLREGGSLPAPVEADDDGLYVLKF